MQTRSRILDEVRVASPCNVAWDDMIGTQRVRYCHHCRLSVYNLSALGREEAEAMIRQREGRLCVRFFRRADGTMITEDCPVGRRGLVWKIHGKWIVLAAALANLIAVFFGMAALGFEKRGQSFRQMEPFSSIFELLSPSASTSTPSGPPLLATPPSAPECFMGDMAVPEPVPQPPPFVPVPIDPDQN